MKFNFLVKSREHLVSIRFLLNALTTTMYAIQEEYLQSAFIIEVMRDMEKYLRYLKHSGLTIEVLTDIEKYFR